MRIIAGKFKGRRLDAPELKSTRPTTDFAREGLFNILQNQIEFPSISFLDLFAGTGAISFEMASRGCNNLTAVELHPACLQFMNKIIEKFGIAGMVTVKENVINFIKQSSSSYDLIFAGPPYSLEQIPILPDLIFNHHLLKSGGWFILEHNPAHDFSRHQNFITVRTYGTTHFSFFGVRS